MEDFHLREKITHFDHERIPERVVHARGSGAHGYFELYESMEKYTKAKVFTDTSKTTPVFVRFSTVVGNKGSADTVRDIRGFSTKFYTEEGNYDLVGNNTGVFFIQDAIKFPDIIHANKPEPHNHIPQATAAHDTFWDFVANNQETAHNVLWAMSDRGIPRSYRMMDGFSINTFRFINKEGISHFVRFRWRPVLGVHGLVWDESQKIIGRDPDFHRRDLWEAIEAGNYPEYELGVQIVKEEDEFKFDFDILDPTKIWPEEEIPVEYFGKMTLNKNVDNFFAETEQSAFHPGHVVPGIDFSNDPLLQGRLFSYTDTQLIRLGGPNFNEIPINRPLMEVNNNQRDGYHRRAINKGPVAYHKNSINDNFPEPVSEEEGGYVHYYEKVDGAKIRARSESFEDHFSHEYVANKKNRPRCLCYNYIIRKTWEVIMAYFTTDYGDIYYRLYGKGETTVVFVSGAAMSTNGWAPFLSTLTKKYRVLLLDLLDQGITKTKRTDYILEDQVDILKDLLEYLNIDKVHLAGMSYGGKVSLTFATKYMDKLESLTLINSDCYNCNFTKELSKSWLKAGETLDGGLFASVILTSMYSHTYYENHYDVMMEKENFFISNLNKEYYERFKRGVLSAMEYDLRDKLGTITVPTLVLTSAEDFVIPKNIQKITHDGIKGSKWIIIEDAGHALMYEKPEEFINSYMEFLD